MDQTQKKKIHRNIILVSVALVAAVIGFMVWCATTGRTESYLYNTAVILFLVIYCFLMDYLDPKLCREFEGITEQQKSDYRRFVLLDAVGYAGLAFFLASVNMEGNMGLLGIVIFAVTMKPKREARNAFYGILPPKEEADESDDAEAAAEDGDGNAQAVIPEDAAGSAEEMSEEQE
ncbi:MAG: hypothetical protein SOZ59_08595 [Candidatus Limivivens sp.]|nr:hypothetical protein [Candidatus Limivivens sp.]